MEQQEHRKGILLALAAYTMWGLAPLYFKLLEHLPATEILLHRIIWSFLFIIGLMLITKGFRRVRQVAREPKKIAILLLTTLLVGGNWLLFIWAINNDHMLDASLGYFINPLLNVLLGLVFLKESLRRWQWLAVGLATIGVLIQVISFGSVPIVSLALALTFGFYGLLRKKIGVDAQTGLLLETLLMLPVAGAALYFIPELSLAPSQHELSTWGILIMAGLVTSLPLLCFAGAAIRIPLSMLGFIQYIGPTLMFILAVFVFKEPFDLEKIVTFGFIWSALIVFTLDLLNQKRKSARA